MVHLEGAAIAGFASLFHCPLQRRPGACEVHHCSPQNLVQAGVLLAVRFYCRAIMDELQAPTLKRGRKATLTPEEKVENRKEAIRTYEKKTRQSIS